MLERSGIITLTTDFGLADTYVGILHGVIRGICPQARLVDLCHQVRPQNLLQGGFLLASACGYFPQGTVHLAVVDPGVGTERPAIAMQTPQAFFVAPDNGLLSWVWQEMSPTDRSRTRIVELNEPRYWLPQISRTFHGRDIFAPTAAHLAAGLQLECLGPPRQQISLLEGATPIYQDDGRVLGQIVHIDHFGNCVSSIPGESFLAAATGGRLHLQVGGNHLEGLVHTYAEGEPGRPQVLMGSSGRLEVAVPQGSAAKLLGLAIHDPVQAWIVRD